MLQDKALHALETVGGLWTRTHVAPPLTLCSGGAAQTQDRTSITFKRVTTENNKGWNT